MLHVLKRLWPPIFLLGCLIFIGRYFYLQAIHIDMPTHFAVRYFLVGVVLHLIYWILNGLCWRATIFWCANVRLHFIQSLSHIAMATLGKYFPGKIWGMIARASSLVQMGVTTKQSIYATLNEQYLILYSGCLMSAVLWSVIDTTVYSVLLAVAVCAAVVLIVPMQETIFRLASRFIKVSWTQSPDGTVLLTFKRMMMLLSVYCLIWLLLGLVFSCVYYAFFNAQPSVAMILRFIVANTIGTSIGFFAFFSPGGLGVREAITTSLLVSQMSLEEAVLLSLMFRLWIVAFELIGGITLLVPQRMLRTMEMP